jgi:uncharacterized protein (TIGR03083 family)
MEGAPQADHIRFLFDPRPAMVAFAGQRRRFSSAVETLSREELGAPSRCAGWTVADVLRHLVWVDGTMRRIWSGKVAMADGFDPRTTPDSAVRDDRAVADEEVQERYVASTLTMASDLEFADPSRFGMPSLSPAGQVPWWMSAVHIGWDSAIHERDALLPLGRRVEPAGSETDLCLAYSLVLTSFFAGRDPLAVRLGSIELRREDGPVVAKVTAGAAPDGHGAGGGSLGTGGESQVPATMVATDHPVEVIDAMSGRGPLEAVLRGDPAVVRRLGGLARYFTST